jgi:hypothetical protein
VRSWYLPRYRLGGEHQLSRIACSRSPEYAAEKCKGRVQATPECEQPIARSIEGGKGPCPVAAWLSVDPFRRESVPMITLVFHLLRLVPSFAAATASSPSRT